MNVSKSFEQFELSVYLYVGYCIIKLIVQRQKQVIVNLFSISSSKTEFNFFMNGQSSVKK